ncbi:hypothetical protein [Neorhodopirellula lusitana]
MASMTSIPTASESTRKRDFGLVAAGGLPFADVIDFEEAAADMCGVIWRKTICGDDFENVNQFKGDFQ